MRLKTQCCVLFCSLAVAASGQTGTNNYRPLSLQDCIQAALLHNRDIQIERFNPIVAGLTLDGSYGRFDPAFSAGTRHSFTQSGGSYNSSINANISGGTDESYSANAGFSGTLPSGMTYTLSGSYQNDWGVRTGTPFESFGTSVGLSIDQPFLKNFWIDANRMTIRINKQTLKFSIYGVDYVVMNIIAQVQQAYYELIYARENVRVQEKLLEVRQRFLDETRRKVEIGASPQLDIQLAQSQVANVQASLIQARNQVGLDENVLRTLMGDNFVGSVGAVLLPADGLLVLPETIDLPASWQRGVTKRPDLAQMRVNLDIAAINLKYTFNQLFPALDLVASYGLKGSTSWSSNSTSGAVSPASASATLGQIRGSDNPSDMIGVLFSVPLTRTTDRANYRISKENKAKALVQFKKQEELVLRQIDDATKNVRASLESVAAIRKATEYAEAALAAEEKKLTAGKSTPFVVLQLQGDLAAAQTAEIRAKANYNQALAQLYFAEGTTMERSKVSVEIK